MHNMPKHVLKQKRLSKKKTIVLFRRNYLDIKDFKKEENGWVFEERFNHYGINCIFKLIIHSDNILSMYEVNCRSMMIHGNDKCCNVIIRLSRRDTPFEAKGTIGCAEYSLKCSGGKIYLDNGRKMRDTNITIHPGNRSSANIPNTVSWRATHPFQGGGVSPK